MARQHYNTIAADSYVSPSDTENEVVPAADAPSAKLSLRASDVHDSGGGGGLIGASISGADPDSLYISGGGGGGDRAADGGCFDERGLCDLLVDERDIVQDRCESGHAFALDGIVNDGISSFNEALTAVPLHGGAAAVAVSSYDAVGGALPSLDSFDCQSWCHDTAMTSVCSHCSDFGSSADGCEVGGGIGSRASSWKDLGASMPGIGSYAVLSRSSHDPLSDQSWSLQGAVATGHGSGGSGHGSGGTCDGTSSSAGIDSGGGANIGWASGGSPLLHGGGGIGGVRSGGVSSGGAGQDGILLWQSSRSRRIVGGIGGGGSVAGGDGHGGSGSTAVQHSVSGGVHAGVGGVFGDDSASVLLESAAKAAVCGAFRPFTCHINACGDVDGASYFNSSSGGFLRASGPYQAAGNDGGSPIVTGGNRSLMAANQRLCFCSQSGSDPAQPGIRTPSQMLAATTSPASRRDKTTPASQCLDADTVYRVRFKRSSTCFRTTRELTIVNDDELSVGTFVIVEGDRGEHIGKIVEEQSLSAFLRANGKLAAVTGGEALNTGCKGGGGRRRRSRSHRRGGAGAAATANNRESDNSAALGALKAILRPATPLDMEMLRERVGAEAEAVKVCRREVEQHHLPMDVVDAEWQMDYCKLTFFYMSRQRVDFRAVVHRLFHLYRARIWMQPCKED